MSKEFTADKAYTQRMIAVCIFAKTSGFNYGIGKDDNEKWDDEWRNVVYIDTPAGQISYHIAPQDFHIFADFPQYSGKWDGKFNGADIEFAKTIPHQRTHIYLHTTTEEMLFRSVCQCGQEMLARHQNPNPYGDDLLQYRCINCNRETRIDIREIKKS